MALIQVAPDLWLDELIAKRRGLRRYVSPPTPVKASPSPSVAARKALQLRTKGSGGSVLPKGGQRPVGYVEKGLR